MSGLTRDCKLIRYGSGDDCQPLAYGIGADEQLYSGAVALVSGTSDVTAGYLRNAADPYVSDIVVGMVGEPTGGAFSTGPGLPTGTTDGAVWAEVLTGAFFFQSGTGSDQLDASTNGKTVYYGGENENGPIACATSGSSTRPELGIQVPQDPGIAGGFSPGANYWPIIVNPSKGKP
jgi:hypothetical protein